MFPPPATNWSSYQQQKLDQQIAAISKAMMEKESPRKESKFLNQMQEAIDRRRISRKRVAALISGPILTLSAPVLGLELMRWWEWVGVDHDASGLSATVIVIALMGAGVALTIGGIVQSIHRKW